MLEPMKNEPARNRVLDEIRRKIFSGAFPPGTTLNPDRLAEELGVSRTPVREALQLLAGEGLIDYVPKQGARVKDISVDFLEDYYNTRKWLEGLAVTCVCRAGVDRSLLARLEEEEREAFAAQDIARLSACGKRLEEYLFHACGSPRLETYLLRLWSASPRRYSRDGEARKAFVEATYRYHCRLIRALSEGDAEEAVKLIERHLDAAKENYLRYRESEARFRSLSEDPSK